MRGKYPEPEYLASWRAQQAEPIPQCCHTCENYDRATGFCEAFGECPPEEFAATAGECPRWCMEVPF